MGEGDDAAACIGLEGRDCIVGHVGDGVDLGHRPAAHVFLARVADGDREAVEQGKAPLTHFTHMLVHGTLHLMGYDHETSDEDAEEMEGIEIEILAKFGFANPYLERD